MAYEGNGVYIWDADHNEYRNIGQAIGSVGPEGPASTIPGPKGEDGQTPNISATASVDANVGTPSVTVSKSGTDANPSFDFAFHNLKGNSGNDGTDGKDGKDGKDGTDGVTPDITATATVDNNVGTPSVSIMKGGTDEEPTFAFNFSNIKGEPGTNGQDSQVPGPVGATPAITATATVDNNTGVPSVNVIKTGTAAEPQLTFEFHNIKGADGANGQSIVGEQGPKGDPFTYEDFTPAQLAALVGPSGQTGPSGTRGSQIYFYYDYDRNIPDWITYNNYIIESRIRDKQLQEVQDILPGDWVICGKFKYFVQLISRTQIQIGSTMTWVWLTNADTRIALPEGPTGQAPNLIAWKVTNYEPGNAPGSSFQNCFWLTTMDGPSGETPAVGQFFFTSGLGTTTLGYISGIGTYNGVSTPYSYFTDVTQIQSAAGSPGKSIYHVTANFTPDNQNRTFANSTAPRQPEIGDIVYNDANTYLANVSAVDTTNNTYTVDNLRAAAEKGETGSAGTTPNVTASATVDNSTGTPSVVVTNDGTLTNRRFEFSFHNLKGEPGANGITPNIDMTAQVTSDNTAVPSVVVTKNASAANPKYNFLFKNIDKNYYLCNAAIVANTNIPVSSLSRYGQSVSASMLKSGDVVYNNEKMAIIGSVNTTNNTFQVTGIATIKGTDGITPNVSATATVGTGTGTPSVTVTNTGTTAAPVYNFAFNGLKGKDGVDPDMSNYYTRSEVNALLYNLKGGGGDVKFQPGGSKTFVVESNYLFTQVEDNNPVGNFTSVIVYPPSTPTHWTDGYKYVYFLPYAIEYQVGNPENIDFTTVGVNAKPHVDVGYDYEDHKEFAKFIQILSPYASTPGSHRGGCWVGPSVASSNLHSVPIVVHCRLKNYDEHLPLFKQKYGKGIKLWIKYNLVASNKKIWDINF